MKLLLFILFSVVCSVVNGQTLDDVNHTLYAAGRNKEKAFPDTVYKSHGVWIMVIGKDTTWICCGLKEDPPSIEQRLTALEKRNEYLVRRTNELQGEIDSLKHLPMLQPGIHSTLTMTEQPPIQLCDTCCWIYLTPSVSHTVKDILIPKQ